MSERVDAHIHLFDGGFRGSFTGRPGVKIDETALYVSLMKSYDVKQALVVCYEGQDWAKGNNEHVAGLCEKHDWIRPVAFFPPKKLRDAADLEAWHKRKFVGISLYIFGDDAVKALGDVPQEVWSWLGKHCALISVNSRGAELGAWLPILDRHPTLRILVSHLGLPPRVDAPPSKAHAKGALADILVLARYPETHIKLSGFYAVTDPAHAWPHRATWPYVELLAEAFTTKRLCWGSDCTPCLDDLTFPQTFGMFSEMDFLTDDDRRRIEGGNLARLLDEVK